MPPAEEYDWDDLDALHEEIERIQNAMDQRRLVSQYSWSESGNEKEEESGEFSLFFIYLECFWYFKMVFPLCI